ncbi:MAG: Fe-S protein assembly co-chaperone HscB [Deltaproteobacteria bacterium]|nr:Fe-S protein assembly co-chaperone HscB [Deltaproteobacteria bacterium]
MTCWKCQAAAALPACPTCGALQPLPAGGDHFAVLGLPRRHDLQRTVVEERQRELSRLVHPDRFATASATERRHSLLWATAVNDAAKALRDPVRRAEYLLQLKGLDVGDQQGGRQQVDPAFLMEMLELREELHAARGRRDDARVTAMGAAMERRRAALLAEIAAGFGRLGEGNDPDAVRALGQKLAVMRYVARFLDEIAAYEETRYQAGG